jgi:FkbM family methyltransferase
MTQQRMIAALARSPFASVLRPLANAVVGDGLRVVRVRTGVARGAQLELDLAREKAYWLGHYEPAVQQALADHVQRGDVVYDVGAHVGFFTVCAARLGARVVAFEAAPGNAARVRRNAELNGLDVAVVEAAVWDDDGGVELVAGGSASEWEARNGVGIPSVTLDGYIRTHPAPALVKIDAEGAELRVLRGAAELLRLHRPVVVCELHGGASELPPELLVGYEVNPLGSLERLLLTPV